MVGKIEGNLRKDMCKHARRSSKDAGSNDVSLLNACVLCVPYTNPSESWHLCVGRQAFAAKVKLKEMNLYVFGALPVSERAYACIFQKHTSESFHFHPLVTLSILLTWSGEKPHAGQKT